MAEAKENTCSVSVYDIPWFFLAVILDKNKDNSNS